MLGKVSEPTILVIDDDDDIAHALRQMLEAEGYRVCRAADGEEGVRMATQELPDLIILDFMLPVKSGFEACLELQQIPALRDVPVLVFTAFGQNIGETYGLHPSEAPPNMKGYLEKPVEPNVLLERVASTLSQGHLRVE